MVPHAYYPSIGGVERVVQQLARSLAEVGHDAAVLTDAVPGAPDEEVVENVRVWRLPFVSGGRSDKLRFVAQWPKARRRIESIVRSFRPDVVHLHVTSRNARYARLAADLAGCPMVITTHGSFERSLNRSGLKAEEEICAAAHGLTHCSQAALEQFTLKHPNLRAKSEVIYNGVNVEDFASPDARDDQSVLFVGRLHPQKGVDVLLSSWEQVTESTAHLIIAGDGPDSEMLHKLADDKGLTRITWMGSLPYSDVIALMKRASVFVVPSRDEGFPMSVLEAMAAGCAIVATRVGGIPEQIDDGVHGLLTRSDAPEPFAAALARMLCEHKYARSLGDNARRRAEHEFDWSHITRQYLAVYSRASEAFRTAGM
jgi:glycosyltransferase involved in cell wall biosynthesis